MLRYVLAMALGLAAPVAKAHELTPTYFELSPALVDNVLTTRMNVFNRREDIVDYRFEVYTADWEPVAFASFDRVFTLDYQTGTQIPLYFRSRDRSKVVYICTRSVPEADESDGAVNSLICSKIRSDE